MSLTGLSVRGLLLDRFLCCFGVSFGVRFLGGRFPGGFFRASGYGVCIRRLIRLFVCSMASACIFGRFSVFLFCSSLFLGSLFASGGRYPVGLFASSLSIAILRRYILSIIKGRMVVERHASGRKLFMQTIRTGRN